jgi:capsular polysaccharide transport system permease protein
MADMRGSLPASVGLQARRFGAAGAPAKGRFSAFKFSSMSIRTLFIVIVLVPTAVGAVYYGLFASKRYVSEAEYIVRGINAHKGGGLDAILTSFGISRAADDTSAIQAFMESRDAVRLLEERVPLRRIYTSPDVDRLSRYPRIWRRDSFESLYDYVQDMISVVEDPTTGITTLKVQAFTPEDAHLIASTLVSLAEEMVNRMNDRAQTDTVRNAREEVARAEQLIAKVQVDLTAFRNKQLLVDPVAFSGVMLDSMSKLSLELAQTSSQIRETSLNSPSNPAIGPLRAKASALEQSINNERSKLAGSDGAIAAKVSAYEQMILSRDLAEKQYASAMSTLETARMEARRQQIYIEEMVRSNLPDESLEPRRFRIVATIFVMGFAAFSMIWILTVGAKDHAQ